MTDPISRFSNELLAAPTPVMKEYLAHFSDGTQKFVAGLDAAANAWEAYSQDIEKERQPGAVWSSAHFFNAINCALISTRLFLEGYVVASGNQARHAIESLAFGVLLPFPATGTHRDWSSGKDIEYKAPERLARNSAHCGAKRESVEALRQQAKWFDRYSHPSRLVLASAWVPKSDAGWAFGALFDGEKLREYKKEMVNRVSLTRLLRSTFAGTHRELVAKNLNGRSGGSTKTV